MRLIYTHAGLRKRVTVARAADPPRPTDRYKFGTIAALPDQYYEIGDTIRESRWIRSRAAEVEEEGGSAFKIYFVENDRVELKTTPGEPWDTRPAGMFLIRRGELGDAGMTNREGLEMVENHLKIFSAYLNGDVWKATVEQAHTCGRCGATEWAATSEIGFYYGTDPERSFLLRDAGIPEDVKQATSEGWVLQTAWDDEKRARKPEPERRRGTGPARAGDDRRPPAETPGDDR